MVKSTISKKTIIWKQLQSEVEQLADKLGKPIDVGIKETIVALRALGFPTTASCEGHLKWGLPYPWVDIFLVYPDQQPQTEKAEKQLLKKAYALAYKMQLLLNEFYKTKTTTPDRLIVVNRFFANGFTLQSIGSEWVQHAPKKIQQQKLALYTQEIKAFTKFLKAQFFKDTKPTPKRSQ